MKSLSENNDNISRCWWVGSDPAYIHYHDDEWGRPVTDDCRLFEKISLEGFQAGLSWLTILRKREHFRVAFAGFDPVVVAGFGAKEVEQLLQNAGIIRHRGKIEATINNAARALEVQQEFGSLCRYLWQFEPPESERPRQFDPETLKKYTTTPAAQSLAKDLRKRGWRFVGPTTIYAFMQAMGMVNDHVADCLCRAPLLSVRQMLGVIG